MGLRIGDFSLEREIGKGGMGRVWSGRHGRLGTPVAMKVLHPTKDERSADALRNEIRSMARLDHPAIAWIYDFGVVKPSEAARGIDAGSPWIAMELASGGSLVDIPRLLGWAELRPFLLRLLDALAHAHARDLIHRDLKPANILIGRASDIRPGIKLADFGIAQALDEFSGAAARPVGTPHYMAPEQILGAYRRQGPWTDLYSLGCVSWLLTTGKRPFTGLEGSQLAKAQLSQAPPAYRPVVNVPEGFKEWLLCLLQKHPRDRFRSAADAAWALSQLADAEAEDSEPLELPGLPSIPPPFDDDPFALDEDTEISAFDFEEEAVLTERVRLHAPAVARMPSSWRHTMPDHTPRRSSRALWGLRPIGFVGRIQERNALWDALAEVGRSGRAQVVWLRGAMGVGKTHLGEWLVHRALEVGAAEVIQTAFEEGESADAGLTRAWGRAFNIIGMKPTLAEKLVRRVLRDLGAQDPTLISGTVQVLGPNGQMDAASRYALWNMLIALRCRQRTQVVFLDDLQWGIDGMRWIRSLMASQGKRPLPILVVGTFKEEGLADQPEVAEEMAQVPAQEIHLAPLSTVRQTELVQNLLGLERTLTAKVVDQTAGNPMFALQLVGQWVESGLLVPSDAGLTLEGDPGPLPGSILDVVTARVEKILDGLSKEAGPMLEMAAVLGPVVETMEWQLAVDDPDGDGPGIDNSKHMVIRQSLEERLVAARLAHETDTGFEFAHPMIVQVLRERAREQGRLRSHAACAASVTRTLGLTGGRFERLGRFLLDAGRPIDALEPLLEGVRICRRTSGSQTALAMVERCIEAASVLSPLDPRGLKSQLLRASILHDLGDSDGALATLKLVQPRLKDPVQVAESLVIRANVARSIGDVAGCEAASLEAVACLGPDGDPVILGQAWWMATLAAVDSERPERVRERALLATEALKRSGKRHSRAEALRMMCYVEMEDGNYKKAVKHARDALKRYRKIGSISGAAGVLLALGQLLSIQEDDLIEAEVVLKESLDLYEMWSPAAGFKSKVALAFLHCVNGDPAAAYALVAPLVRDTEVRVPRGLMGRAWVAMVEACAGLDLWAEFDHALTAAERHLRGQRSTPDELRSLDSSVVWTQLAQQKRRSKRMKSLADRQRSATQASTKRV